MKKLKCLFLVLFAAFSCVVQAEDSIYVQHRSGLIDVYGMAYLDSINANEHQQMLTFSFPRTIFEPDDELDTGEFHWSSDATEEQKAAIRRIVDDLTYVQGGTALIGAQHSNVSLPNYNLNSENREGPVHRAYLSSYYIGRHTVTHLDFIIIMQGTDFVSFSNEGELPEMGISWENAQAFIDRLNYLSGLHFTLPTEAQWEFAARGGGKSRDCVFSGSNIASEVGWTAENSESMLHASGLLLPNELGIYDMTGNIFEWCSDWYADYTAEEVTNPTGPEEGDTKVARGGCYLTPAQTARNAYRFSYLPTERKLLGMIAPVGVRVVLDQLNAPNTHYLDLSEQNLTADPNGQTFTISVSASENFYISQKPYWCQTSIDGNDLMITVAGNYSGLQRYGTIVVTTSTMQAEISVTQDNCINMATQLPTIEDIIGQITWSPDATDEQKAAILELVRALVSIEGGNFQMGAQSTSPDGLNYNAKAQSNESPVHSVNLSAFYLGKYAVTRGQWIAIMGEDLSYFRQSLQLPEEGLSWRDAENFAEKLRQLTGLDFTLPSEAQWEYAARGGNLSQGYTYSGSNDINQVGWVSSNGQSHTHEVGSLAPNELGLYDMSGNIYEWCSDWFAAYSDANDIWNPTGPANGSEKIGRGGSQALDAAYARNSARLSYNPESRTYLFYKMPAGVRIAMNYIQEMDLRLKSEQDTLIVNIGEQNTTGSVDIVGEYDWCSAEVVDGKLCVYVQPNYSGAERQMSFVACTYGMRMKVNVTQEYREVTLDDVIPQEIQDLIDDDVITYNPGFNPPNIEGVYLASPHNLARSSLTDDVIGRTYSDMYIRFSNQTSSNTLDYEDFETAGATALGPGAFLTGEGNKFSAFFNITGSYSDGVTTFKQAIVVSGEKTSDGIVNYSFTFVMIDKYDPNNRMVPVGTYRTFCDGDNTAENATWPDDTRRAAAKSLTELPLSNSIK